MAERVGGASDGLSFWTPALRALWTPAPRLQTALSAYAARALSAHATFAYVPSSARTRVGFEIGGPYLAMHVRANLVEQRDGSSRLARAVACVRARLTATNTSRLFVATMYSANRRALAQALRPHGISVHWLGRSMEAQGESAAASDSALLDMMLMGGATEVLVTPGSTFGYVAQGLAGRRATVYGGTHTSRELVGPSAQDCSAVSTTEPNFHYLRHALRAFRSCRDGEREAKARSSELVHRSSMLH